MRQGSDAEEIHFFFSNNLGTQQGNVSQRSTVNRQLETDQHTSNPFLLTLLASSVPVNILRRTLLTCDPYCKMSVPPETIQVKRIKRTASDRDAQELADRRDDSSRFDGPDYLRPCNSTITFLYTSCTNWPKAYTTRSECTVMSSSISASPESLISTRPRPAAARHATFFPSSTLRSRAKRTSRVRSRTTHTHPSQAHRRHSRHAPYPRVPQPLSPAVSTSLDHCSHPPLS